ncbi:hypothetical protein MKX01_024310 [Papaver californicum]|nr:hypothetical protein MKX01_024310 [Papaver californicum]
MSNSSIVPSDTSFNYLVDLNFAVQYMMYGFGDYKTVALLEDIAVEYVTDLVHKAQDVATKRGKLLTDDFLHLIRKDIPKRHRRQELLSMNEELKQAKKTFRG